MAFTGKAIHDRFLNTLGVMDIIDPRYKEPFYEYHAELDTIKCGHCGTVYKTNEAPVYCTGCGALVR